MTLYQFNAMDEIEQAEAIGNEARFPTKSAIVSSIIL